MADKGGVADVLRTLLNDGVNLRTAGGRDLDRGGEFVFAVHHRENDNGDSDDRPGEAAAELLRSQGYAARTVRVRDCLVDDTPGSLLGCIEQTEAKEGPVYEIFVGTANADGRIPLQITTRRALDGEAAS